MSKLAGGYVESPGHFARGTPSGEAGAVMNPCRPIHVKYYQPVFYRDGHNDPAGPKFLYRIEAQEWMSDPANDCDGLQEIHETIEVPEVKY